MINAEKFTEALAYYMFEKGYTRKSLAEKLGVNRSNVTKYLSGNVFPDLPTFINLCVAFGCSADYLAGLRDDKPHVKIKGANYSADRLRSVLNEFGVSQYRLQKDLKVSASSVWAWLSGKATPSVESLVKIAEYLDCSLDYILGTE